ncbi:MAG: hypothetical protein ACYTDT_13580, partial [Planctomycetota bacterium]
MMTYWKWVLLCAPLLLLACEKQDEDEETIDPVVVTTGTALSEPTTPTNNAIEPANAYDGSRVHLVYSQNDGAGVHALKYTQRLGGGSFLAPADLYPGSTSDSRDADVTLDSSLTLHVVWTEGAAPSRDIYYVTRTLG